MESWAASQAKARFAELIRKAQTEGPQTVTQHGRDAVVVLSVEEFRKLRNRKPKPGLKEWILSGPKSDEFARIMDEIVEERRNQPPREIDL